MSVIPKIICPPDYSIRCFRLIDPMSFGIIKGAATEIAIPTKGICIPVNRYDDKRLILKAGSTLKVDVSGIAEYGELQEEYQFSVDLTATPDILGEGTKHKYELYDSELNLISSIEFTVSETFSESLLSAVSGNSTIYELMNFDTANVANGNFTVTANAKGVKYRHIFYFDLDGFGGSDPHPYVHPGNLVQKYRKYPDGRIKVMLIIPGVQIHRALFFRTKSIFSTHLRLTMKTQRIRRLRFWQRVKTHLTYGINRAQTTLATTSVWAI